jgi:hypothetical protein
MLLKYNQWQNVEKTAKSSIQEKKIRVTFLPALEGATESAPSTVVNGTVSSHLPLPPLSH